MKLQKWEKNLKQARQLFDKLLLCGFLSFLWLKQPVGCNFIFNMEVKYDSEAIVQFNPTGFLMFLSPPKKNTKRLATLPYLASEMELLAYFNT